MKLVYTKHAQDKLRRKDIIGFGINKKLIRKAILNQEYVEETRYGVKATLLQLNGYTLRVICVKMGQDFKVITFHIARKGRYERKVL